MVFRQSLNWTHCTLHNFWMKPEEKSVLQTELPGKSQKPLFEELGKQVLLCIENWFLVRNVTAFSQEAQEPTPEVSSASLESEVIELRERFLLHRKGLCVMQRECRNMTKILELAVLNLSYNEYSAFTPHSSTGAAGDSLMKTCSFCSSLQGLGLLSHRILILHILQHGVLEG